MLECRFTEEALRFSEIEKIKFDCHRQTIGFSIFRRVFDGCKFPFGKLP
jgi:hypothetical protein